MTWTASTVGVSCAPATRGRPSCLQVRVTRHPPALRIQQPVARCILETRPTVCARLAIARKRASRSGETPTPAAPWPRLGRYPPDLCAEGCRNAPHCPWLNSRMGPGSPESRQQDVSRRVGLGLASDIQLLCAMSACPQHTAKGLTQTHYVDAKHGVRCCKSVSCHLCRQTAMHRAHMGVSGCRTV